MDDNNSDAGGNMVRLRAYEQDFLCLFMMGTTVHDNFRPGRGVCLHDEVGSATLPLPRGFEGLPRR